ATMSAARPGRWVLPRKWTPPYDLPPHAAATDISLSDICGRMYEIFERRCKPSCIFSLRSSEGSARLLDSRRASRAARHGSGPLRATRERLGRGGRRGKDGWLGRYRCSI